MEKVEQPVPGVQQQPGTKQHPKSPQQQAEAPKRPHPTLSLPPNAQQQFDVANLKEPGSGPSKDFSTKNSQKT